MNKKRCFVIQPFREEVYEKRYKDIFKPAIADAGVNPYRVDHDPNTTVIISAIEKGIQESEICFAEITADNPNVWYELGYAMAIRKEIVMVCEQERALPFDIQHRRVIKYKGSSLSDFNKLKREIKCSIEAVLQKKRVIQNISEPVSTPLDQNKMPPHVLTALVIVGTNSDLGESVEHWNIKEEMNNAGFNNLATNLALEKLIDTEFLIKEECFGNFNEKFILISLTEMGKKWLSENQDNLNLRITIPEKDDGDDIPF